MTNNQQPLSADELDELEAFIADVCGTRSEFTNAKLARLLAEVRARRSPPMRLVYVPDTGCEICAGSGVRPLGGGEWEDCDCVTPTILSASRTPPLGVDRNAIARAVDPKAFEPWEG